MLGASLRASKARAACLASSSTASRTFSHSARRSDLVPFKIHGQGSGVAQNITVDGSGHSITSDTYPAFGGADAAPSPLHYNLTALSSCTQVTGSIVAKDHGIKLTGWDVSVTGEIDPSVLVGGAKDNGNGGNWNTVHLSCKVKTDGVSDSQFQHWTNEVERRCPVTQLFKNSGVKWTSEWQKL